MTEYVPRSTPRPDLMRALDIAAEANIAASLPVEKCWQPSDLLPNLEDPEWHSEVSALRTAAAQIPDHVLVTLVANMITEEALPSYHAWLTNLELGFDRSGRGPNGMAVWIRGWVAEEKRHGDALSAYLLLSGRVSMRAIEVTIQHLIRNGFDPLTENCAIQGFVYTAFQERATYVSHSGVGRLARQHGDETLARICDHIAGDEVRHQRSYERFISNLFQLIPDDTMIAMAAMLRKTIIMPSRTMWDGVDRDIFPLFSSITQRNGIYTSSDYARILAHLVRLWNIDSLVVSSSAAKEAQDFVAQLPARYRKLAERADARVSPIKPRPISWLMGRVVGL